jgi:putative oxidoreductase
MKPFILNYNSQVYALMRIVVGFLFLWHGAQKLFGIPIAMPGEVPAFITYVAGPIELIGGTLIMIGLFTRWAAFLTSGQMAVAYWMVHGTKALLPIQNNGELAVLYCFIFLFISTQGGVIWSVDAFRNDDSRRMNQ